EQLFKDIIQQRVGKSLPQIVEPVPTGLAHRLDSCLELWDAILVGDPSEVLVDGHVAERQPLPLLRPIASNVDRRAVPSGVCSPGIGDMLYASEPVGPVDV